MLNTVQKALSIKPLCATVTLLQLQLSDKNKYCNLVLAAKAQKYDIDSET